MKRIFQYWTFVIVAMFMITGCSTEAGIDDGTSVKGVVKYTDGIAAGAIVSIAYGASEATSDFDQVTVADDGGNYHFDGLNAGDYYIDAVLSNPNDIEFNSPGVLITVGGSKDDIVVDFNLK